MCKKDLSWLVEYLDLIGPSTLSFTLLVLGRKCFRNIDAVKGHYMDLNNLIVDMTCFAFLARKEVPFKMLRAFGRLFPSMTHLVVRVRWADGFDNSFGAQFRQIWDHDSRWPAQGCPRYERKWMATLDERKFALRLAKCLLSIQFLVLEFSGKRRSYWQIERTDKGPCSTKLKSGLGEDILAARGL
ncbi:hypothetical protein CERSUDRAFT_84790 [Gelatoporia subvermispora B]|uniref:Uncharacterized protein n=1 Tax=Ceriporiopsis subvermispora (strain B) TaxID=914234 RepID=M2QHU0_CERS8|nr:hypothetical protein CERSUDRAFT_84790 [Gelatoporia subvermispora B]